MNEDLEHLRLLSIFHYLMAALFALFSLFPVVHLVLGVMMLAGSGEFGADPPPAFVGWLVSCVAVFLIFLGLAFSACFALAGRNLARHRSWIFCMVIAGIACTMMPVGTVLGIFTILVLNRPSVRALFEGTAVPPAPLPQTGGM
jgi:uncharacterized BrkB/YihY/UPF0761 family membrane protein